MEEKINNQKIFRYIPPTIAKILISSDLNDSDIFFKNSNKSKSEKNNINIRTISNKLKENNITKNENKSYDNGPINNQESQYINPNIFPISHLLDQTLIMCIRLKGFEKLIYSLIIDDKENKKERLHSEYLSIIVSRLILKISSILSDNGGEVIKYNDFEILVIWNFSNTPVNKVLKNKKFYSKYALISAIEIMKKFDDSEILGTKIELSIGIGIGESEIVFFGGERKRSEYIILGEAIEQAELCIENSLEHEIIISKEMNNLFKIGQELITRELKNDFDQKSFFAIDDLFEDKIKNFDAYKGMKLNNNNIYMNTNLYENLANKVYIFSSILPQGLIKYLDVGNEENLKEISILTVATLQISISLDLIDDINLIQNLIFDIQKATYMTFGSLLYITKSYYGFLIRCAWGIDPSNYIDNPARAISTSILIAHLSNYYNIKIGIGITTGACFSGLISVQGNRKIFTLMGKKVNFSRTLADEALSTVMKNGLKYLIYCDKLTMKHSQKNYRHTFVSNIKIFFNNNTDTNIYFEFKDDFYTGIKNKPLKKEKKERKNINTFKKRRMTRREIVNKSKSIDIKNLKKNNELKEKYEMGEKQSKLIQEIYTPIENDDLFLPSINDPFPLIRTHLYNSFNPMNKIINLNIKNPKTIFFDFMLNYNIKQEQMTEKALRKLKKSETIFGYSKELNQIIQLMNETIKQNKKQFIAIKGPPGVGKSLFIRKAFNNFIGLNENLSKIYFGEKEFLFCNLVNPFINTLPYNTISIILRKIYFYILKYNLVKELFQSVKNINLDNDDLSHISFILSIGKNDINIKRDFDMIKSGKKIKSKSKEKEEEKNNDEIKKKLKSKNHSIIADLEGPYNYQNINKLNMFFYEMIKIYKNFLQSNLTINNNNTNNFLCPLIFVLDDGQKSNNYSFEFIQYLFSKEDTSLNPFIFIIIQQTPFHYEYNSFNSNKSLEIFISTFGTYIQSINQDKIHIINIKPLTDKKQIEKLIIFCFKDLVKNNYKTNLEKVDEQILSFLLQKSFNGIPLLVISLFKSLIKSEKFIQTLSAEFIITSDLIDDKRMLDWSDILLPFEYDKYCSMKINSILNFKETLIFKYACIIGTIFDLKTLDKLNPLYSIIKLRDLKNVIEKLNKEQIIEIFPDFKNLDKNKNFFCKISFPFMREVFLQKFPIEYRKILHMKIAKIISTDKKINYFSTKNNMLILHRHLLISETDIVNGIETKKIETIKDLAKSRQELNYNNLKMLLVKELYSKFCYPISNQVLEGNLELYFKSRWMRISYYIERGGKIYFNQKDIKKGTLTNILIFSIEEIYKNQVLKNVDEYKYKCRNVLEISISATEVSLKKKNKKCYYFRSEQREELNKLDIAINFLRVKVNYDKFIRYYGIIKFPLFKYKWFLNNKANKYNSNIELSTTNKRKYNYNLDTTLNEKLFFESNNYYTSFKILFNTSLSIILGTIQENIIINKKNDDKNIKQNSIIPFSNGKETFDILKYFTIPDHLSHRLKIYFKNLENKGILEEKKENNFTEDSIHNYLIGKLVDKNKTNKNEKKLKKFINVSQPKKAKQKRNKNSPKSSNKTKRKNKTVEKDKTKPKINNNKFNKHRTEVNSPNKNIKDITFNNYDSEESNNNPNISNKAEEFSFNSELNGLLANKKVQSINVQSNNINKSRNIKNTKPKISSEILNNNDKNSLKEDFIPLTERTNDRSHVQYIDTQSNISTERQKINTIYNFDLNSIMTNSNYDRYKKEIKFKTMSDNPKYAYVELMETNKKKKSHKGNLFVNVNNKKKQNLND